MKKAARPDSRAVCHAVAEYFPYREIAIRRLMKTDASFRQMCEELTALKTALARHPQPSEHEFQKRQDERLARFGCVFQGILGSLLSQRSTGVDDP